jgi:hypothetical protein
MEVSNRSEGTNHNSGRGVAMKNSKDPLQAEWERERAFARGVLVVCVIVGAAAAYAAGTIPAIVEAGIVTFIVVTAWLESGD